MVNAHPRRPVSIITAIALAFPLWVAAALTVSPPATAAVNDQGLSGVRSPMWQTNNNVEALAVSGGVLYAGGTFTRVRPPGAAPGTQEVVRNYLAAFNANTGALINSFNVQVNGRVDDISISPNGQKMYIVGMFTQVNGQTRQRVAAINIPQGTLDTGFTANASATVMGVDSTADTVYVTGDFSTIRGVSKSRFAALNASNGAVRTGFTADLDARGIAIEVVPNGSRVLVGGEFLTVNGTETGAMASVDPVTGDLENWQANTDQPINIYCAARVTDILAEGQWAYVTAEGDPPGCYEGTYRARTSDGLLDWNSTCLGGSLGLALLDGVLYKGSHQHDCAFNPGDARGGYVGGTARDSFIWWRLVAQDVEDGSFVHWSPNTNSATGSNPVGPHVMATDGRQLFVGGDFDRVDTQIQQGLARYEPGNGAAPNQPEAPTVQANRVGGMTVIWPATLDRDSGTLTYRLYRNNQVIHEVTAESYPWSYPILRYDDNGLPPGSNPSYRVVATDGVRTGPSSQSTTATVRSTPPPAYADLVRSLGANLYWRLGDVAGGALADSSTGGARPGVVEGGVSPGASAVGDGASARLDGATGHLASRDLLVLSPSFTQSVWFRTTSITGGSLLAVTDAQTGIGTISDRAVTMDNNGNIVFSVHQPPRAGSPDPFGPRLNNVRLQGPIFNDGNWHQVVATWTGELATLYVDGRLLGTYEGTAGGLTSGYQRVGYTDLTREQAVFGRNYYNQKWPLTEHFDGDLDEVATFPTALTAEQVAALWAAGVNDASTPPVEDLPPTADFTTTTAGLTASFDGTPSDDPDGEIVDWEWDFDDGDAGSGEMVDHTYDDPGTYDVTLTVTDDDDLTHQVTREVTVQAPGTDPEDVVVVAEDSEWAWRYQAGDPPETWNDPGFDDAGWQRGDAVLGLGTTVPLATNINTFSQTSDRPLTAHFRRTFEVGDASDAVRLRLDTVADDGVVIYVNGTEVTRHNMPAGPITSGTWATSARNTNNANADPVVVDVPLSLLVDGTNVVAAETHLNYRATRDVSFRLEATLSTLGDPPPPPPPGGTSETTVVDSGAEWAWRYQAGEPGTGWRTTGFDDASWPRGDAVLGFGTTVPIATDIDTFAATNDRPRAAHFRRTFDVADASSVVGLRLDTIADDGVVVHVNGVEVARHNMPGGPVDSQTWATAARNTNVARADPVVVDVPVGLLSDGANVIAVETHVNYRATRDVSFDLEAVLTTAD